MVNPERNTPTDNSKQNMTPKDRDGEGNLLRFHGDAATSAVEEAAINYQSPSIIAAGANAQSVSILTTLINLSLSLICIKAPALIEKMGLSKKGAVTLSFLNLIAWVPLILVFLFSGTGITPAWFAFMWLVNLMPGVLLSFQRDNWMSNLVPGRILGGYLGQRLAIKSAFYLGAFCLLGYMMDRWGGKNLAGFAFIFSLALVMSLVDYVIFTFMREPGGNKVPAPAGVNQSPKFGLFDYIGELKQKKLNNFIVFTSLFYLTVGLTGPLYAVYMLQERHFTYLSFTAIISAEYLARVVSAPFWGKFADRSGNIRVLGIVSRIIPAIPICWLFCSNIGYLVVVQVFSGACWGAFDLCNQSYLYKVAPPDKKLRYIVYTRCLVLLSTAMGGLLGAYLVDGVFMTFGSRLLSVFMISGFFRAIVVMYLMPKLVDLAVSYGKPAPPPEASLEALGKAIASRRGLFYKINEPDDTPQTEKVKRETALASYKSDYVKRRNRAKTLPAERTAQSFTMDIKQANIRRAWYYTPPAAGQEITRNLEHVTSEIKTDKRKTAPHSGLYYDNAGWTDYLKDTLQALAVEIRANKTAAKLKPAFAVSSPQISGNTRTQRARNAPTYLT
jgi:hypothetical protein